MTATSFTVGVTGRAVRTTDEGARAATIQEDPVGGMSGRLSRETDDRISPMARKPPGQAGAVVGVVKWFDADEGLGVLEAPEVPGGCFVHFSSIEMPSYQQLHAGQRVRFTFERPGFLQDGYSYALWQYGRRHDCRDYQRQKRAFQCGVCACQLRVYHMG